MHCVTMGSFGLVILLGLGSALFTLSDVVTPHMWSKLILTHHWPATFCSMEHCKPQFDYWTLHGLWPNKGMACNSSWHFNASLIEDIIPEMEKWWPDLFNITSSVFWKHEWIKHGTCAAKAEALNSQHKYFSKALELYHKLDLDGTLKKASITPSETYYSLEEIEGTIFNFYGVKPKIQCLPPGKGGPVQILGQIELCFDSELQLTNCEKAMEDTGNCLGNMLYSVFSGNTGFSVCNNTMKVYYPPFKANKFQ